MSNLTKDLFKDKQCDLDFLIGKKINNIGFSKCSEGGLTIDYNENNQENRLILGFTELGMWIQYNGPKNCKETISIMKSIRENMDCFLHEKDSVSLNDEYLIIKGSGCECECHCPPEPDCCDKYTEDGYCNCPFIPPICNCKCTCGGKMIEFKYEKKYIPNHIIESIDRLKDNQLHPMGFYFELSTWADTDKY